MRTAAGGRSRFERWPSERSRLAASFRRATGSARRGETSTRVVKVAGQGLSCNPECVGAPRRIGTRDRVDRRSKPTSRAHVVGEFLGVTRCRAANRGCTTHSVRVKPSERASSTRRTCATATAHAMSIGVDAWDAASVRVNYFRTSSLEITADLRRLGGPPSSSRSNAGRELLYADAPRGDQKGGKKGVEGSVLWPSTGSAARHVAGATLSPGSREETRCREFTPARK